jgi:hypothetical protein
MADTKPTPKQLRELRRLAHATGTSFSPPRSRAEASREISRLRRRPASSRIEVRLERDEVASELHGGTLASAPRDDEIVGYGSSARWAAGGQA